VRVSRVIAVGLGSVALTATAGAPAAVAERAQAKCVSKVEYQAIHQGQSKARVHQIVQNQTSSAAGGQERYTSCGWTMNNLAVSGIAVVYRGGKVSRKFLVTGSVS